MLNCLLGVGKPKEPHFQKAIDEYAKRLARFGGCQVQFVRAEREEPNSNADELKAREGLRLLKLIQPGDAVWAMCVQGRNLSSEQWAEKLTLCASRRLWLVIGGQLGLSKEVEERADLKLSLGAITLPHELAAVVALEQLYRAHSINAGMPYHRA